MSRTGPSYRRHQSEHPAAPGLDRVRSMRAVARGQPAPQRRRDPRAPRGTTGPAKLLNLPSSAAAGSLPADAAVRVAPVPPQTAWPRELTSEAELLLGAMVPRGALWLLLSDRNRRAEPFAIEPVLSELRRRIRQATGGLTRITSSGDYVPPSGPPMEEETVILLILLPKRLDDRVRSELLDICVGYGWVTEQEEVLVLAGNTTVCLPTGTLLDTMDASMARKNLMAAPGPHSRACGGGVPRPRTRPDRPAARGR